MKLLLPFVYSSTIFSHKVSVAGVSCISSLRDLEDALSEASPGDQIHICDGDYEEWKIEMDTVGVRVSAVTPGQVSMHHSSHATIQGSDNNFSGVVFHGGGSTRPITIDGDRNTVSDCVIEHHEADNWVEIQGINNTVTNCRFSEKTAKYPYEGSNAGQQLLQSRVSPDSHHNNILNNVFYDYHYEDLDQTERGNGYETIQIRDGEDKQGDGHNTVEGNYFYGMNVEVEVISIKSRYNLIQNNAFESNEGSVTLRDGDFNTVFGNVFMGNNVEDSYGIRIFNKHHIIKDNWMSRLKDGGLRIYAGGPDHVAAENVTMESNTMEDCFEAVQLGHSYNESPVEPIVFINNIVSNNENIKMIEQNNFDVDYDFSRGNYFFGSNLGWDNGEVPDGLIWEEKVMDVGPQGDEMLQKIKCNAGPSWENTC